MANVNEYAVFHRKYTVDNGGSLCFAKWHGDMRIGQYINGMKNASIAAMYVGIESSSTSCCSARYPTPRSRTATTTDTYLLIIIPSAIDTADITNDTHW